MQELSEIEQYLIEGIEQGKVNFFVGAGISVGPPAKMPSGPGLTQELLKDWVSGEVGDSLKRSAKSGALRLEVVMQIARETFSDR